MEGIRADLLAAAQTLAADAAGAQALRAWESAGVAAIVLKGPTLAGWLYRDAPRPYADIDLLVGPAQLAHAGELLSGLGFAPAAEQLSHHAHPWVRADGATIDLHETIWGPSRDPDFVWRELQAWTVPFALGPVRARALNLPARALHVVLHGAQHRDAPRNPTDLARVLHVCPPADWRAAQALADRLWALLPMAQGLTLEPAGRALLEQLPLARAAYLTEYAGAPLAVGFARLAATRGLPAKAGVIARALATRSGARGMAWTLAQTPRTLLALRRSRGRGERVSPGSAPHR